MQKTGKDQTADEALVETLRDDYVFLQHIGVFQQIFFRNIAWKQVHRNFKRHFFSMVLPHGIIVSIFAKHIEPVWKTVA